MPGERERTAQLKDAIEHMTDEQIECRDCGHSWRPHTASRIKGGGFERAFRCTRCGTIKRQILDRSFDIVSSTYSYAEGYQVAGLGFLSSHDRSQFRGVQTMGMLGGAA